MSAPQQQPIILPQGARDQSLAQGPDWKRQLAERLDAYRSKHPDTISQPTIATNTHADSRASRIARSVASRYAAAPSYSELLAITEAENAAAEAQAAFANHLAHEARVAENARIAQEEILQEETARIATSQNESEFAGWSARDIPVQMQPTQIPPAQTPAVPVMPQFAARSLEMHVHQAAPEPEPSLEDLWASSLVEPRASLPSKLIEFPRELVSAHRARPRLPENPESATLSTPVPPEPSQLRIFEVHPEEQAVQLAQPVEARVPGQPTDIPPQATEVALPTASNDAMQIAPQDAAQIPVRNAAIAEDLPQAALSPREAATTVAHSEAATTARPTVAIYRRPEPAPRPAFYASPAREFKDLEWAAISLDKELATRGRGPETSVAEYVPFLVDPAPIDRRLMAFAVDFAAVTAGFLGFLVVFVASTPHLPTGLTAVALAGVVYAALWLLYQMLFFSLSGATAGMLYARIALCTFDDQNPTRSALRRRLAAWWLSCLPIGIGFLWCFIDEDNLGWHDRMTRMYQRGY